MRISHQGVPDPVEAEPDTLRAQPSGGHLAERSQEHRELAYRSFEETPGETQGLPWGDEAAPPHDLLHATPRSEGGLENLVDGGRRCAEDQTTGWWSEGVSAG